MTYRVSAKSHILLSQNDRLKFKVMLFYELLHTANVLIVGNCEIMNIIGKYRFENMV